MKHSNSLIKSLCCLVCPSRQTIVNKGCLQNLLDGCVDVHGTGSLGLGIISASVHKIALYRRGRLLHANWTLSQSLYAFSVIGCNRSHLLNSFKKVALNFFNFK